MVQPTGKASGRVVQFDRAVGLMGSLYTYARPPYKDLIVEYLKQYGKAKKRDIRELLWDKLPDVLSDVQKENKIRNILTMLKKQGIIDKDSENQQKYSENQQKSNWILK